MFPKLKLTVSLKPCRHELFCFFSLKSQETIIIYKDVFNITLKPAFPFLLLNWCHCRKSLMWRAFLCHFLWKALHVKDFHGSISGGRASIQWFGVSRENILDLNVYSLITWVLFSLITKATPQAVGSTDLGNECFAECFVAKLPTLWNQQLKSIWRGLSQGWYS